MKFIRLREVVVCVVAACSVYACATGTTSPGGDGAGGDGGEEWGGPVGSASSSSSGSTSSGSSGSTVCDTNSADCTACIDCSRKTADGLCVDKYDACLANTDCTAFAQCFSGCADGDTICTSDCESFYPIGKMIFDVYASCVICQDCYVKCDGAGVCM